MNYALIGQGLRFVLRGYKGQTFYGAHSMAPLEIKGNWNSQGSQPVDDDGGVPTWVAAFFDANPNVDALAISGPNGGIVWGRQVQP